MKILFVITCLGRGGADRQVIDLAMHYKKNYEGKINVRIVSMLPLGPMGQEAISSGIDIISLNMIRGKVCLSSFLKFLKIMYKFKPDIVHSHMLHSILITRIAKVIFCGKLKTVDTLHNICLANEKKNKLLSISNFLSNKITYVSKSSLESYKEIIPISEKTIVVNNAINVNVNVNVDNSYYNNEKMFIIGALGRIHPVKNYKLLIESFCLFNKIVPRSKLTIAGHGDCNELLSMVESLNIIDKVEFVGPVDDIEKYFSTINLYVSTSLHEGFGLSLAEAILNRKLYITTDSGGVNDIVKNKDFITSFDANEISNKMLYIYKMNREDANFHMDEGFNYVSSNFDINVITSKWLKIYNEL